MFKRRFIQADVFSSVPARGNGLAVVVDADGLSDDNMQNFAAWTNLAETTFLLPPTDPAADYRVRIFTPGREMPFAGHPTLGSCAAWLHCGGVAKDAARVIQECGVGLVEIDLSGPVPAFVAPPTTIKPLPEADITRLASALNLARAIVINGIELSNGPVWQVLELADANAVLAVDSSRVSWPDFVGLSLIGAHPADSGFDFEVRMISPSSGMSEDPITGSLNAAIAHSLMAEGHLTRPLVMRQGTCIGREGRVFIMPDQNDRILIGGAVQILIDGWLTL
ncbi:MAG: PhzF family phenazine biosynthesis protein [Deltaproteobacteria bacterium]